MSVLPGRRITSVPRKPITTAVQRRRRTVSPRITAARIVVKNGAVKPSAVASVIGSSETDQNQHSMLTMPTAARSV